VSGAAKRAFDVIGATIGLILLAPLLIVLALAIRVSSPGPTVFRQRRVGRDGREFVMWKLRTMVVHAEQLRAGLMAQSRDSSWLLLDTDPRVTPVGRVLRRTCLDELPQLVNVFRGDMSLVGPRPLPLEEHACMPEWASVRHRVRPGITGAWQVAGRTEIGFTEMLRLDCEYAREASLRADARILVRTGRAVVTGRGAN